MIIEAEAVLFDNDGVLVDTHDQVVVAWTQLAREFGLEIAPLLVELVGRRAADTLGRHLSPEETERAVARLEDLEVEHAGATRPIAGAVDLISGIEPGRWTIVTSASRRLAVARWRGAGIPESRVSITAEDVNEGKPSPEPFLAGAAALGVAPERCVVFEDSPSGGVAALSAGATVVAVGRQEWPEVPAARVPDLNAVSAEFDREAEMIRLRFEI